MNFGTGTLKHTAPIGTQVVQGQGLPTAHLGQQISVTAPPADLGVLLIVLLPITPSCGKYRRALRLIRWKEHDHATGGCEAFDLLGRRATGQRRLPDHQARVLPVDLACACRGQDLGLVLQTCLCGNGQCPTKGLARARVVRDHHGPAQRRLGKHEVKAIVLRICVTR